MQNNILIARISYKYYSSHFAYTKFQKVLADKHVHILGSYQNIKLAKDAICALVLGSPPGKVYAKLRQVAARVNERI